MWMWPWWIWKSLNQFCHLDLKILPTHDYFSVDTSNLEVQRGQTFTATGPLLQPVWQVHFLLALFFPGVPPLSDLPFLWKPSPCLSSQPRNHPPYNLWLKKMVKVGFPILTYQVFSPKSDELGSAVLRGFTRRCICMLLPVNSHKLGWPNRKRQHVVLQHNSWLLHVCQRNESLGKTLPHPQRAAGERESAEMGSLSTGWKLHKLCVF